VFDSEVIRSLVYVLEFHDMIFFLDRSELINMYDMVGYNMTRERKDGKLERIVRAKWTFDEAQSIEEMSEMLRQKAEFLEDLESEGWELVNEVKDDYAILVKDMEDE
jgi:hypothetical protein